MKNLTNTAFLVPSLTCSRDDIGRKNKLEEMEIKSVTVT